MLFIFKPELPSKVSGVSAGNRVHEPHAPIAVLRLLALIPPCEGLEDISLGLELSEENLARRFIAAE